MENMDVKNTRIIKVPGRNGLSKTRGCEKAPSEILESLKEIYSNEQGNEIDLSNLDIGEVGLNLGNINEMNKQIYEDALKLFKENEDEGKNIFFGGDHSISFSLVSAFRDFYSESEGKNDKKGRESCLIVFDAHPDLMPSSNKNSPNHEEWLRELIEEKRLPPENILLVGIRNSDPRELEFIKEKNIRTVPLDRFVEDIDNIADTIMEFCSGKKTYVSIDIDVLDPVFAPGTGYKEPGGLTSRQLIYVLKRLNKMKNLKALDIVEVNPSLDDGNRNTVKLGAKILSEFL